MNRRDFLLASACGAVLAACSETTLAPLVPVNQRWGLQLFTVGALLEADFEGTLAKVAALGYREVETVGSFGRDPAYVRAQLDRLGLVSPSQHIASDAIYASFGAWTRKEITTEQNRENYERAFAPDQAIPIVRDGIRKARQLGQTYVTWPILMPKMLADRAILDTYIRLFDEAGKICREEGLVFAFHNHAREFERIGGDVIYDLLLAGTDGDRVKMEMDFYWAKKAGADALAYLAAHSHRFFGCHIKDIDSDGEITTVGTGLLDLPNVIASARAADIRHFFVEYDRSDDPLRVIEDSIRYLRGLT